MQQTDLGRPQLLGTNPVTLRPLPPVDLTSADGVRAAVERARRAQPAFAALGFEARAEMLVRASKRMLERREDLVELLHDEVGKPAGDVLMSEALAPLDAAQGWIKILRKDLAPERVPLNPVAFPGKRARIELEPRGVIGVIAPWNFPLAYFMKPLYPALLAGNAVVLKPSEYAPRTAKWLVARLREVFPTEIVQCVVGGADTGRELIRAGIDGLVFTGSVPTGREVVRACAEQMIPVSVELGGKDPAIVLDDAELDRTVLGICHWSFTNAGQSCSSIERVYVLEGIADRFVAQLADAAERLATEPRADGSFDVGPLVNERQLRHVEGHVRDALERGAVLRAGGKRTGRGFGYRPTVLDRVTHDMKVATEETFGPVVGVVRVASVDEAVRLANDSRFGLNASVWSRDVTKAEAVARRLEAGVVLVNNHSVTGAVPSLPWSGVKDTGYGVANGRQSYATFVRPKTYLVDANSKPDAWWLPIDARLEDLGERLADAQLGRVLRAVKVPLLLAQRVRGLERFARGEEDRVLTPIERRWGALALEAIFPRSADARYAERTREADVDQDLDELLRAAPAMTALGIRAAIVMYGLAPLVLLRRLATFDALTEDERIELAARLSRSPVYLVRQMSMLLKTSGALSLARTSHLRPVREA
jgi:acyl-CoA reductase-like NAD-dependent aldehyde dehydrogenase